MGELFGQNQLNEWLCVFILSSIGMIIHVIEIPLHVMFSMLDDQVYLMVSLA